MSDEPFVQPDLSALATGPVRDLKVELSLPVGVQLCLQVVEQTIPAHRASLPASGLTGVDHTVPEGLLSNVSSLERKLLVANRSKLH